MTGDRKGKPYLALAPLLFAGIFLGSTTSCRAFLDLEDPPPGIASIVDGVDCEHPIAVAVARGEGPLTIPGSTTDGESNSSVASAPCDGSLGPERVYAVTADAAGFLTARLKGSRTTFDSVLYAATSCDGGVPGGSFECADRKGPSGSSAFGGEVISFQVVSGETRYIVVDGATDADEGDYEIEFSLNKGDNCDSAIPIVIENGTQMTLSGNTADASNDDTCTSNNLGNDVVYSVTGPLSGGLGIEVDATGFDVTLYLRQICSDSFTELACLDDGAVSDPEGVDVPDPYVSLDKELYVWIDSAATSAGGQIGGPYKLILRPLEP